MGDARKYFVRAERLSASVYTPDQFPRPEQEEALNVAMVVGGSIVIPHLRRVYEFLEELYG